MYCRIAKINIVERADAGDFSKPETGISEPLTLAQQPFQLTDTGDDLFLLSVYPPVASLACRARTLECNQDNRVTNSVRNRLYLFMRNAL